MKGMLRGDVCWVRCALSGNGQLIIKGEVSLSKVDYIRVALPRGVVPSASLLSLQVPFVPQRPSPNACPACEYTVRDAINSNAEQLGYRQDINRIPWKIIADSTHVDCCIRMPSSGSLWQ